MNKEEFTKLAEEWANTYAKEVVYDSYEHPDAVEAIVLDYVFGALAAYEFLTDEHI